MEDKDVVCIPFWILKTTHREHYFNLFRELCQKSKNQYDAWHRLEEIRSEYLLPKMYDNFDSFKNSYYYHINSKIKK